jgi:hypothetical protein
LLVYTRSPERPLWPHLTILLQWPLQPAVTAHIQWRAQLLLQVLIIHWLLRLSPHINDTSDSLM